MCCCQQWPWSFDGCFPRSVAHAGVPRCSLLLSLHCHCSKQLRGVRASRLVSRANVSANQRNVIVCHVLHNPALQAAQAHSVPCKARGDRTTHVLAAARLMTANILDILSTTGKSRRFELSHRKIPASAQMRLPLQVFSDAPRIVLSARDAQSSSARCSSTDCDNRPCVERKNNSV